MEKDSNKVMDLPSESKTKEVDRTTLLRIDAEMKLIIAKIKIAFLQTGHPPLNEVAEMLEKKAPSTAEWMVSSMTHMSAGTTMLPIKEVLEAFRNVSLDISPRVRKLGMQTIKRWSLVDLESVATEQQVKKLASHITGPYCKYQANAWKMFVQGKLGIPTELQKFKNLESELNITLSET
jgi:hypothetical protein